MELILIRRGLKEDYTIGELFIDGKYFCDTLEDKDRNLISSMTKEEIKKIKVPGETAIPLGDYEIDMNRISPRFSKVKQYDFCKGKLPYLKNVPGYEGVLIHIGNYARDTEGCILVGKNTNMGMVTNSTYWFKELYKKLEGNKVTIKIAK